MKKKPPPGATLIARLKERRMQREQDDSSLAKTQPVLEVDAQTAEASETSGAPVRLDLQPRKDSGNLIHKTISIEDLRPSTDDYYALTEEIRLAGRFAAVGLIAQGLRLAMIRGEEIHRDHYTNFEEYCRKEHHMSATYAYRLIRMAEMAEEMAQREIKPDRTDPFDAMLHLGHRHLMALLPLSPEEAEDYLVRGIPVEDQPERVPIAKATEKQIKLALKKEETETKITSRRWLPKDLLKLAKSLEECAIWLETQPHELAAMTNDRGPEYVVLARRFRLASERISQSLSQQTQSEEP